MEMLTLRRRMSTGPEGFEVPVGTGSTIEARVEDVSSRDAAAFARDDSVMAYAPPIPLELIAPVATSDVAAGSTAESWGLKAVGATTSPFTGKGVTVAILDTGIDRTHPAFSGVEIVGRSFLPGEPADRFDDAKGHGTHCAGTIFGRPVGGTRIGVAPGVSRALIGKVIGNGGSTGTLVSAINWAIDNKAHVISMSLGFDFARLRDEIAGAGAPSRVATSRAMAALVANVRYFDKLAALIRSGAAFGRAALVVAAAGNESDRTANVPVVLGAAFPSAAEDFVSIAAVEESGDATHPFRVAKFSNSGAAFAAPGVRIISSIPGGGLTAMDGTSMATPHIAGVAALWAQKLLLSGTFSATKLLDKLRAAANLHGLDDGDVGYGVPMAPQA